MTFEDQSFDFVVSTLSMHHWADASAGLTEVARVLRPSGRALVWDFKGGRMPLHSRLPDPVQHVRDFQLVIASMSPWRWPWRFAFTERIEFFPADRLDGDPRTTRSARSS